MAIIDESSTCVICDGPLDRPFIGLPDGGFAPSSDRSFLTKYFDAPIHQDCLASWEYRVDLSRQSFMLYMRLFGNSTVGHLLIRSERWALLTGPKGPHIRPDMKADFIEIMRQITGMETDSTDPFYAAIQLRDWPIKLSAKWEAWETLLAGSYHERYIPVIANAIDPIVEEVRRVAPTTDDLRRLLYQQQ